MAEGVSRLITYTSSTIFVSQTSNFIHFGLNYYVHITCKLDKYKYTYIFMSSCKMTHSFKIFSAVASILSSQPLQTSWAF